MTKSKLEQGAEKPDLLNLYADLDEFERLKADREAGRKALALELGPSDAALAQTFERIQQSLSEGLTLTAAGILAGVTRRTLAVWVKLADERRKPWCAFFDAILKRDAQRRAQHLGDLRKLAERDTRCYRDWVAHSGRPSPLEYELQQLRKVKGAAMDAHLMPASSERNAPKAEERATDDVSSGRPNPSDDLGNPNCTEPSEGPCNEGANDQEGKP